MPEAIFVYGSLRAGFSNHRLLANAVFDGYDNIKAKNISSHNLFAITDGTDDIAGEVYLCDAQTMSRVDALEGIDWGFYLKKQVTTASGKQCFAYYLNLGENSPIRVKYHNRVKQIKPTKSRPKWTKTKVKT